MNGEVASLDLEPLVVSVAGGHHWWPIKRVLIMTCSTILYCPDAFSQGLALSSHFPNPWLSALQSPCWLGPVFLPSPHLSVWSPGSFYQLGFGGLFEEVGIAASQGVSAECGKAASWAISEKWRISAGGRGISVDMGILALVGIDTRLVLNWLI